MKSVFEGQCAPMFGSLTFVKMMALSMLTACVTVALSAIAVGEQSQSITSELNPNADIRHVVLMLEQAPLHLRLRIKLGGQSLSTARAAYVARLHRQLDQDGDGQLSVAEAARSPLLRQDDPTRDAQLFRAIGLQQQPVAVDVAEMVTRIAGETVVYRQDDSATESDGYIFGSSVILVGRSIR